MTQKQSSSAEDAGDKDAGDEDAGDEDSSGESAVSSDSSPAKKPYDQILSQEIDQGEHELKRPVAGLFLSGLSGGLDIGFSLFLMAVMKTLVGNKLPEPVAELLVAGMYPIGFIFVVLGRSELFTEHTTLAVLPVLDRRESIATLGRTWAVIYSSNVLGAAIFALVAVCVGPRSKAIDPRVFGQIAQQIAGHDAMPMLLSGVLAGWLMGLLSWLVTAARDTISQIAIVVIVTSAIGVAHLHHSIAGTTEVLAGVFSGQGATWKDFARFLVFATLGNAIGGIVFVAVLKYSHASRGD